jgi:Protein of unknown function (DUF3145)
VSARGVVYIHSAPPALCPHVEWAVAGVLGVPVTFPWVTQPAAPGMMRGELAWQGKPGSAGAVTSALTGWNRLRFEVTEEASPGCDAIRHSYTPSLGIFSAVTGGNGDILIPETRLRAAIMRASEGGSCLEDALSHLLGEPWDAELEPFRYAGEGAPVRWLHATG